MLREAWAAQSRTLRQRCAVSPNRSRRPSSVRDPPIPSPRPSQDIGSLINPVECPIVVDMVPIGIVDGGGKRVEGGSGGRVTEAQTRRGARACEATPSVMQSSDTFSHGEGRSLKVQRISATVIRCEE